MAPKKTQSRRGGFSLVELMIAIGILGVGLTMVSTMLPSGILNNSESNQYAKITGMLDNAMPTIRMSVSHSEMQTYLTNARTKDAAITSVTIPEATYPTYPVYSWPSASPLPVADLFYGLPLACFAYPNPAESLAALPVPLPPVGTYFPLPFPVNANTRYYKASDWGTFTDSQPTPVTDAVPSSRDGWMMAVCPAEAATPTANDYYFILFPYRKILPGDVCHVNFQFVRVNVNAGGIVFEWWDDANAKVVAGWPSGLVNSPVVDMANPSSAAGVNGAHKLVEGVDPGNGNVRVLRLDGAGNAGWWLAVRNMNGDASPAVGAYIFRDRLKS